MSRGAPSGPGSRASHEAVPSSPKASIPSASYEVRREMMPIFGERWVIYVDGKRRNNCGSKARALKAIERLKERAE